MTSTLDACCSHPADPEAFDRHHAEVHAPLGLAPLGLRPFTGTTPGPGPDGSPAPVSFIAALAEALTGPEGAAAVADLASFAGAGVALVQGPTTTSS